MEAKYKRVILKISGEALSSDKENIDFDIVNTVAKQVVEITELGASVGIIVGGGNIWRGRRGKGMDRITADHMGMLATVINSLALQDALENLGAQARLQTAIEMRQIAEPYIRPAGYAAFGKGADRHFCLRHGESLLHDGYGDGASGGGNGSGSDSAGQKCRRRL